MNGTSCILCDGESFRVVEPAVRDNRFGSPGSWRILACESCGLWQTDPVPTQGELQALYERHYNFGGEGETGSAWARLRALFLSSPAYRLLLRVDGDVSFHARRGRGRLLDVGCNEGRGLSLYAANGFQAEGLELNRVAGRGGARQGLRRLRRRRRAAAALRALRRRGAVERARARAQPAQHAAGDPPRQRAGRPALDQPAQRGKRAARALRQGLDQLARSLPRHAFRRRAAVDAAARLRLRAGIGAHDHAGAVVA